MQHKHWFRAALAAWAALALVRRGNAGDEPIPGALAPLPITAPVPLDELPQVQITAPEPRYVAPTRRDRIGRISAPVMINGQGPFRLVLGTGASHSGITARVAQTLGT